MNSNDTGKILGAIAIGAIAGAILGVLFAPDKGSETRKKLFKKAKDLSDDAKKKVNDHLSNFKAEAEAVKDSMEASIAHKRTANGNVPKEKRNQDY
jgi:gas vesicle protein